MFEISCRMAQVDANEAKTARSSRAGAKAARVIRVVRLIRLIRLVKLYKAIVEVQEKRNTKAAPGEEIDDLWDDDDEENNEDAEQNVQNTPGESNVGQKLSQRTTKTLIILILAMLMILNLINQPIDHASQAAISTQYGAELVQKAWRSMNSPAPSGSAVQWNAPREQYESTLISYIYSHNWYAMGKDMLGPAPIELQYESVCEKTWCSHHPHNDDSENNAMNHRECQAFKCSELPSGFSSEAERAAAAVGAVPVGQTLLWIGLKRSNIDHQNVDMDPHIQSEFWTNPDKDWNVSSKGDIHFHAGGVLSSDSDNIYLENTNIPLKIRHALSSPWPTVQNSSVSSSDSYPGCRNTYSESYQQVYLADPNPSWGGCIKHLRPQERQAVYTQLQGGILQGDSVFKFLFDKRQVSQDEAVWNIIQTWVIICFLGIGALSFSSTANKLVILPLESMMMKVKTLRANPLAAINMGQEEYQKEEKEKNQKKQKVWWAVLLKRLYSILTCSVKKSKDAREKEQPMETVVLEKTIIKLGGLLVLGFGEAGSNIVSSNIGGDSSSLNVMIPGKNITAIFGHVEIKNFDVLTDVLQDKVMIFVRRSSELFNFFRLK